MKKNDNSSFWKFIRFLLKIPYYLGRGFMYPIIKIGNLFEKEIVNEKRKKLVPKYEDFKIINIVEGDYKDWIDSVYSSDSKIGIILGARGTGKTAFGMKFLENYHSKYQKKCYAMGFDEKEMPSWINVVDSVSNIKNNSIILVDEGGILFSSRESMSNANKLLSDLILISRHKNLTILFITQNSSNLEVNILRQADFLILKPSSLLQTEFERKIVQKIYDEVKIDFKKYKTNRGLTYIYSSNFRGFISNPLPSFWKTSISKSFK